MKIKKILENKHNYYFIWIMSILLVPLLIYNIDSDYTLLIILLWLIFILISAVPYHFYVPLPPPPKKLSKEVRKYGYYLAFK